MFHQLRDEQAKANAPSIDAEQERLRKAAEAQIAKNASFQPTDKISDEYRNMLPHLLHTPFGLRVGAAEHYTPVPANPTRLHGEYTWRIELHGLAPGAGPLGLDVLDDVILGRGTDSDHTPDVDLDPYGALEKGISRRHAMLRPTRHSLYLLDLQSTNGTRYNALPLGVGIVRALTNNDTISLGNLSFQVKIIDSPTMHEKDKVKEAIELRARTDDADPTKPLDSKE